MRPPGPSFRRSRGATVVVLVCCSCTTVVETPVRVSWNDSAARCSDGDAGAGEPNEPDGDGGHGSMNVFVAEVFALLEGERGEANSCAPCATATDGGEGVQCEQPMRRCRCSRSVSALENDAFTSAFTGLRTTALDPSRRYCVRVLALELEAASESDQATSCDCEALGVPDLIASHPGDVVRVCGWTKPLDLGETGGSVMDEEIKCRGRIDGGFGGAFQKCVCGTKTCLEGVQ